MQNQVHDLSAFSSQKYMNIETYRRSGEAIRTPVWFVESGGLLFFLTRGDSGKVKRLRHTKVVKIAPCKMDGEVTGPWATGQASFVESDETVQVIKSLFDQKYGAVSRLTNMFSRLQRKKRVFIKVLPEPVK
jgi:PPOX class probable F420-dependent enzyme